MATSVEILETQAIDESVFLESDYYFVALLLSLYKGNFLKIVADDSCMGSADN